MRGAVEAVPGSNYTIALRDTQTIPLSRHTSPLLVPTLRGGTKMGAPRPGTQSVRRRSHAERGNERWERRMLDHPTNPWF